MRVAEHPAPVATGDAREAENSACERYFDFGARAFFASAASPIASCAFSLS